MNSSRIKAVIFDLGNVLINFDHMIAAKKILEFTRESPQEIYRLFFDSGLTQSFEEGKISARDFFSQVKSLLKSEISFEEFLPIWNEIFFLTDENQKVYELARSISNNYKTVLLSNINELHFVYLKKKFPIFDGFHAVFTSYELGAIKPNPLIYLRVLKILEILPHEAFYVDDRQELILKASELGIKAFLYNGSERLKEDLLSCGVNMGRGET